MQTTSQLHFLQQKIEQLQSAIFYNQSTAPFRLPTALVQSIGVDDQGQVWFWMRRPAQIITAFEKSFPVRLDFYRKGSDCFLQVAGNAQIVTKPEEAANLLLSKDNKKLYAKGKVLVKVKMLQADYHEVQKPKVAGWWQTWTKAAKAWLWPSGNGYTRPQYMPAS